MSKTTDHYAKTIIFLVDDTMSDWLLERRELTGVPTSEFLRRLVKQAVIASAATERLESPDE